MSKKLAVFIIHGMGSPKADFADAMVDELSTRIGDLGKDAAQIVWQPIYWADVLEQRELSYFKHSQAQHDLHFPALRQFILTAFGDASAYRQVSGNAHTAYADIHAKVSSAIATVYADDLESQDMPMLILAHSLGGHIISNYIWDAQQAENPELSAFENMQCLAGLVTFGCNIPMFTFAHQDVQPITFPPSNLAGNLKAKAQWLNYYDADDVLAYPLKTINDKYDQVVDADIAIQVGGVFSSWNPLSHDHYWTDNDFTKPVAQFISRFL
ncbi:MAG: hypothetical protein Q9M19_00605 [Mariprofundaceae bacterium]|nr:hypothetical protein [Mariprofundaceae bacterium]